MRLLPDHFLRSPAKVLFAPADRFFVRVVPLAADLSPAAQAELALESFAPFPPAQLYWGCWVAPGRTAAVVYAAHRRRFTAEETAPWEQADLVVPDLLPLLGAAPGNNTIRLWREGSRYIGAAWNGDAGHPAAVLARTVADEDAEGAARRLATELKERSGLVAEPRTVVLGGTPRARRDRAGLALEWCDPAGQVTAGTVVTGADGELLDIRDRGFLVERRRQQKKAGLVWGAFLACGGLAAAALVLDLAAVGLAQVAKRQQSANTQRATLVTRLETAHGLANRLEELTVRRLRFFEMLDAVNRARPASILFTRVASNGRTGLEIEAQTGAAGDIGTYESELRTLPNLERIEVRDLRAREGVTTFGMAVAFKDESGTGGAP